MKPTSRLFAMSALVIASLVPHLAEACSRILWDTQTQGVISARSMDWDHSFEDNLYAVPRGLEMNGGEVPDAVAWTAKYGSVVSSIYPYAKKLGFTHDDGAIDGLNEAGFAVHGLYLESTTYAEPDGRPAVSLWRTARYMLDNFATVEEAVAGMNRTRIHGVGLGDKVIGAHFAIEDASGDSAILEIIDGELVVHHGKEFVVMTNDPPYDWQQTNLKYFSEFGGYKSVPGGLEGGDRFVRLSYYHKFLPTPETDRQAIGYILSAIRTVTVPFGAPYYSGVPSGDARPTYPTWWISVADLDDKIYYFNWVKNANIVWVDLDNLDLSEGSGLRVVDPKDPELVGDIAGMFRPVED